MNYPFQVGCHKETDSDHLLVYQINPLSLGLQKTLINHKMKAICFLETTYLQSAVHIATGAHYCLCYMQELFQCGDS